MPREPLPQNYIKASGSLFEDFETIGDWFIGGSGGRTALANTNQYLTGSQSIKLTVTGSMSITKSISAYLNNSKTFRLAIYQHSAFPTVNKIWLLFSTQTARPIATGGGDKYLRAELRPQNMAQGHWSYWVMDRDTDFISNAGETWASEMKTVMVTIVAQTGEISLSFDDLRIGMEYSPRLMIAFDDNRSTAYDIAYPYMKDRGLLGTVFAIKNTTGLPNYMTLANLQALYADGWAIANHTVSHAGNGLIDYDLAGQTAELSGCTDWLIANGMPRAAHHVAYPLGVYNADTMTALANLGMLTGRISTTYHQYTPVNNPYLLIGRTIASTDSLSTIKGVVDTAFNKGVSYQLIFHKLLTVTDGTTTWWTPANFQALIDYILARKIPCVTIDEWYKGLTNPRYRSLPLVRAVV